MIVTARCGPTLREPQDMYPRTFWISDSGDNQVSECCEWRLISRAFTNLGCICICIQRPEALSEGY